MLPSEAWSSPPELFMKPEVNLQRLKGFKGFIFGRKDVGLPIMYDLYDENYILYNYFRPFLSSSEVQNLQRLQTSVQAFTWLLSNLKILASLSSSSLQVIFTDFILGRTKWPWKGIKPKGHVHFLLFSSFILFFQLLFNATQWWNEQHKEILPTMEILCRTPTLINRTCPVYRRIWMKWCSMKNMPVLQCHWLAQWQMNLWSSKYHNNFSQVILIFVSGVFWYS